MRKSAEVFLLAENRLLREALIRLLSKRSEVSVVGASAYSANLQREIIAARPQIILMDSSGLESSRPMLISALRCAIRSLRIVMVDMEPDEDTFLGAIRAGVVGYVLKNASALEVAAAIRAVAVGQAVCPPSLCMVLFRSVMQQTPAPSKVEWAPHLGLSRREQETAELLRHRLTNKEIAQKLNLSEQTVKNHVHRILQKLGAPDRFSIAEFCENRTGKELYVVPGAATGKDSSAFFGPQTMKAVPE